MTLPKYMLLTLVTYLFFLFIDTVYFIFPAFGFGLAIYNTFFLAIGFILLPLVLFVVYYFSGKLGIRGNKKSAIGILFVVFSWISVIFSFLMLLPSIII
jgi:hypothetical protein